MSTHRFFGYGSLVNRATQDYPVVGRATLHGWRRVWRSTSLREMAYLSVRPDTSCDIHGLMADVPDGDWGALDIRETGYDRQPATTSLGAAQVYEVPERNFVGAEWGILLSYLDVVVQGYLREFGEEGVAQFFATTDGWTHIHNDRENPIYPRSQVLTKDETALVDHWLSKVQILA